VKRNVSEARLLRGFRIGKLGVGLTGSYLGYQLQNLFFDDERREQRRKSFQNRASSKIREELQSLKGPVMKLGQALSMQSHLLPEEMIAELANLQMRAPAMHPSLARAQFKASFGKSPEEVFRSFTMEPFAAASLGQVHRAVTKAGEQVAVKIQYPAIRSAIENDFTLLRSAAFLGRLTGHIPESIISEMEQGILQETDYLNEAKNTEFFRERLKPLPYVRVPAVFRQFSTDRVLTMSHLDGEPLMDFLARKPSQELRNQIGVRLMTLFCYQMHALRALHADPHPGNYLIDARGTIGLVDFGCVKKFSPEYIEVYQSFVECVWLKGEDQYRRTERLMWGPQVLKKPRVARKLLKDMIDFYKVLWPAPTAARTVVDFSDGNTLKRISQLGNECFRNKFQNPEFLFSSRAQVGLYNVLHLLRAKMDISAVWADVKSTPSASEARGATV
jgi:predicted unusual protein kinase regulating ubiquinone biosynthesis (AarF/ABC1/UbiB family)